MPVVCTLAFLPEKVSGKERGLRRHVWEQRAPPRWRLCGMHMEEEPRWRPKIAWVGLVGFYVASLSMSPSSALSPFLFWLGGFPY